MAHVWSDHHERGEINPMSIERVLVILILVVFAIWIVTRLLPG